MGYQTDFVGYLEVTPTLNDREITLLNRISGSIFIDRPTGGLRVADELSEMAESVRKLESDMPRGWSNWSACSQGCCLSYDGGDKANHMVPWLKHLMATFLVPGATAGGLPGFEELTCDHVLNGMVVGSRRDNRELYSITVRDNVVEVELLWPGVKSWSTYPPLAYQTEIDRFRAWVLDERRRPRGGADRSMW